MEFLGLNKKKKNKGRGFLSLKKSKSKLTRLARRPYPTMTHVAGSTEDTGTKLPLITSCDQTPFSLDRIPSMKKMDNNIHQGIRTSTLVIHFLPLLPSSSRCWISFIL
ncbi:hypothetical protein LINPERPRIM_LOCUS42790 [Linum perenne]